MLAGVCSWFDHGIGSGSAIGRSFVVCRSGVGTGNVAVAVRIDVWLAFNGGQRCLRGTKQFRRNDSVVRLRDAASTELCLVPFGFNGVWRILLVRRGQRR